MPDTSYGRARTEWLDTFGGLAVANARISVVAGVLGFALLGSLGLVAYLLGQQTIEPYVIHVDGRTGDVARGAEIPVKAKDFVADRSVIERELVNMFVRPLYALNSDYPTMVRNGHVAAYAYTRGKATEQFRTFMAAEQPYQRQATNPGLSRTVEKKTVSFQQDGGLVLIRYRTSERSNERVTPVVRDWLMTLQYVRNQPSKREDLDVNPLGLYITTFEIAEER